MSNLQDVISLIAYRKPGFTWWALTRSADFASYVSARRDCRITPFAAFHAILELGPQVRDSRGPGSPWRMVSAELCGLGYR